MGENKTLIAYATRGGTTEDYAKAIGSVLTNEFKMQVDIVNLRAIKKYVDVILQKNIKLKPIAVEVFGGRMRMLGITSVDTTDTEKAKEWVRKIAEQLRS